MPTASDFITYAEKLYRARNDVASQSASLLAIAKILERIAPPSKEADWGEEEDTRV